MAKFQYVDSVPLTVAKRIVAFAIGETNLFKSLRNEEERTFDFYITDDVKQDDIDYLIRFWGKQYRFFRIYPEQVKLPLQS